ncbi:MAG: YicC family protein [Bacteroidales bacterium]
MTGYGKSVAEIPGKKITIEIKSLNSKSLDLNIRLPWLYKEKESEIRNIISQLLDRGKIDLTITFDMLDNEIIPVINKNIVKNYFIQLKEIASELGIDNNEQLLPAIIRLPDALKTEKIELPESEWLLVSEKITESAMELDKYRAEEGKSLEKDILKSLNSILMLLEDIEKFESDRIPKIREKLKKLLLEYVGSENVDKNRYEQELIYYLEKLDINEEKVRLRKHCEYLQEKISSPPPNGKILGFISQEIGREINTIGSKAYDAAIQKIVVMMKDELEKIKELSLNVL